MSTFLAELAAAVAAVALATGIGAFVKAGRYAERLDRLQKIADKTEASISKLYDKIDDKMDPVALDVHKIGERVSRIEGRLNGEH